MVTLSRKRKQPEKDIVEILKEGGYEIAFDIPARDPLAKVEMTESIADVKKLDPLALVEIDAEPLVHLSNPGSQGKDIMDEAVKEVTLDRFLDRNPKVLKWPEDYEALVTKLRKDRALFITAEANKGKGKKKSDGEDNETDTEES